jgi:hypothetical protein
VKGSGKLATERRDVPVFSGIELRLHADVYISQGDKQSIQIEAEENILPVIITSVKDDELLIDSDEGHRATMPVNIHITVKDLCLLELTGSGSITSLNSFNCDMLTMRLSGSGEMHSTVIANSVKATLAGSGKIDIKGLSQNSDLRITGSGSINAQNLESNDASVSISGNGACKLDVINELLVNITGIGNVYYLNEPATIRSRITGQGDVLKI